MENDPNLAVAGLDPTQRVPAPASITKPMPATKAAEIKYYVCHVPAASMHREDGKKIAFVHGICAADILYDQIYMDKEIEAGSTYIRVATPAEIEAYKMRMDPHGAMKAKVTAELSGEIEARLRAEITAEIAAKNKVVSEGGSAEKEIERSNIDANKIAGTNLRERINTVNTNTTGNGNKVIMESGRPPITPVSSTDLKGTAPVSGK